MFTLVTACLAATPILGLEQFLDAPLSVRSDAHERGPSVANVDGGVLVTFISERRGQPDVWAHRVDDSGQISAPQRVSDSDALFPLVNPSLACTDRVCLVAWQDDSAPDGDVRFRRLTLEGSALDGDDRSLATTSMHEGVPVVVADGDRFVVAYTGARGSGDEIFVVDVSEAGVVGPRVELGLGELPVLHRLRPGLALAYVAAEGRVSLLRLDRALRVTERTHLTAALPPTEEITSLGLASRDDVLLASWSHFTLPIARGDERSDVYALRVGPTGPIDPAPLAVGTGPELDYHATPAFDGTAFQVFWFRNSDPTVVRRSIDVTTVTLGPIEPVSSRRLPSYPTLTVLRRDARLFVAVDAIYPRTISFDAWWLTNSAQQQLAIPFAGHAQRQVALTALGENFLAVFHDRRGLETNADDLYLARLTVGGQVIGTTRPLAVDPAYQGFPSVAATAAMALAVWYDERDGHSAIRGARIASDGMILDPHSLLLAETPGEPNHALSFPTVATDGTDFMVAFSTFNGPRLVRVASDGTVGQVISAPTLPPLGMSALAFGRDTYLLLTMAQSSGTAFEAWATRLGRDGAVVAAPTRLFSAPRGMVAPSLIFDGTRYLATWEDHRVPGPTSVSAEDVMAMRLSPEGASLDGDGFVIHRAEGAQGAPSIAFNGHETQIAWFDFRGSLDSTVQLAVLDPAAPAVVANVTISSVTRVRQVSPRLAFNSLGQGLVIFERFLPEASAQRLVVRTVSEPSALNDDRAVPESISTAPDDVHVRSCGCDASSSGLLVLAALLLRRRR